MKMKKLFFVISALIISAMSAPTTTTASTTPKPSQPATATKESEFYAALADLPEVIAIAYGMYLKWSNMQMATVDNYESNVSQSEDASDFKYLPNLKQFKDNENSNGNSAEGEENQQNLFIPGMEEEFTALRETLLEGFEVYKSKYEPIVEHLHHKAESMLHRIADDDPDIETLEAILNLTQQMRESVDAFLALTKP